MGAFNKLYLTTAGQSLLYKAQTGKTLKFTKFKLGDGELNGRAIAQLTDLISLKKEVEISKLKIQNNKVTVGCNFNNSGVEIGFYWRELGIYAEDPDTNSEVLYLYGNSGDESDYIPAEGADILEKFLDANLTISDVENISAVIDDSLVFVSVTDLNNAVNNLEEKITAVDEKIDETNGNVTKIDAKVTSLETAIENIDVTISNNTDTTILGILKGDGAKVVVATESDIIAAIPQRAAQWDEGGTGTGAIKQELELLELELALKGVIDEHNVNLEAFLINMANTEDYVQSSGYFDSTTNVAYI